MHCVYCKRLNDEGVKNCSACGVELFPIAYVDDLPFELIPQNLAPEFKAQKVGFFSKGALKKVISSIENGTCGTLKVRVENHAEYDISDSEDTVSSYVTIYHTQTLQKHPISDSVEAIKDFHPADMSEAYLFRIKVGKKTQLLLVSSNETKYLLENIKSLLAVVDARIYHVRERDLVDAAFDNVGKFVSGLFSKK